MRENERALGRKENEHEGDPQLIEEAEYVMRLNAIMSTKNPFDCSAIPWVERERERERGSEGARMRDKSISAIYGQPAAIRGTCIFNPIRRWGHLATG